MVIYLISRKKRKLSSMGYAKTKKEAIMIAENIRKKTGKKPHIYSLVKPRIGKKRR